MCEMLAASSRLSIGKEKAFLTGMFSLLDALLDNSLEQLLTLLPLESDVREALLNHHGELGQILALLDAYDQADWEKIAIYCQALGDQGRNGSEKLSACAEMVFPVS